MERKDIILKGIDLDYEHLENYLYIDENVLKSISFQNRVHMFIENISYCLDGIYKSYIRVDQTLLNKSGNIYDIEYKVLRGELPNRDEIFYKNSRRLRAWYLKQGYSKFEEYFVHIFVYLDGTGYISYLTQEEENKRLSNF